MQAALVQYCLRWFLIMMGIPAMFAGCASTPDPAGSEPQALSGTDEQIFIGDSVEMNYDPNVIMKRAESYFEKESYAEALVEYKHFLDLHRTHVLAPYAQYKIGMSHIKMFKSIDRDPAPIERAMNAFQQLLVEFPGSRHETDAQVKIRTCKELLARHHLFVGEFYYRREAYLAAAHRFENVIQTYPGSNTSAEAMLYLARTYQAMGAEDWAVDWLVKMVTRFPESSRREEALDLLAQLSPRHRTVVVAQHEATMGRNGQTPRRAPHPIHVNGTNGGRAVQASMGSASPAFAKTSMNGGLSLNGKASPSSPSADPVSCTLGSWCESSHAGHAFSNGRAPTEREPVSSTTVCKLGQWC